MDLERIKNEAREAIEKAKNIKELESLRVQYLGRKEGEITKTIKMIPSLPLPEKKKLGPEINALKKTVEKFLEKRLLALKNFNKESFGLDMTMPVKKVSLGHLHPLTIVEKEIRDIFKAMHFSVIEGPEVETDYYNFDALNIPQDHPARDMWDTFWLQGNQKAANGKQLIANSGAGGSSHKPSAISRRLLLRTHTSPMQVRYMEVHKPPFQIIVPGRVFRYEAIDASHEINFYQVEGLMVGKDVNLANFKYVIREFFRRLFKKNPIIRLRPSYFPFVEPGLEVDVECIKCGGQAFLSDGQGCNLCKGSGWLEVIGAGMVHPRVFEAVGYNPREFKGFAFGLGLERIAMIKYNIPDIRLFYSGDLRFIKQF